MSSFDSILKKFERVQEELKAIGNAIVEKYPESKKLTEFVEELNVAAVALDTVQQSIADALVEAETDDALKKSNLDTMAQSEIYKKFKPEEREKLAEFLVQSKRPLADEEKLKAYVEMSLQQKPSSDLLAMIPKQVLLDKGAEIDDGSEGFDAYSAGMEAFRKQLDADKLAAVKRLVDIWMQKGLEAIAREYYAEALKVVE